MHSLMMKLSNLKQLSQVNLLGIFISNDLFLGEYCKSIGLSNKDVTPMR